MSSWANGNLRLSAARGGVAAAMRLGVPPDAFLCFEELDEVAGGGPEVLQPRRGKTLEQGGQVLLGGLLGAFVEQLAGRGERDHGHPSVGRLDVSLDQTLFDEA